MGAQAGTTNDPTILQYNDVADMKQSQDSIIVSYFAFTAGVPDWESHMLLKMRGRDLT